MSPNRARAGLVLSVVLLAAAPLACSSSDSDGASDGGAHDGGTTGGATSGGGTTGGTASGGGTTGGQDAGGLRWYATCGDPVCRGDYDAGTGKPRCTTERVGQGCSAAGSECDPGGTCGENLRCTDKDPQLPGCPVSSRSFKQGIHYLDAAEVARTARELESIRLARYAYRADPSKEHLGFILEDQAPPDAVLEGRSMIDLYGYTSMVVAALQDQRHEMAEQAKTLEAQRREIELLRASVQGLRGKCATPWSRRQP